MVPNGTFPGEIQFVGERGESTNNARQRSVCKLKAAAYWGASTFPVGAPSLFSQHVGARKRPPAHSEPKLGSQDVGKVRSYLHKHKPRAYRASEETERRPPLFVGYCRRRSPLVVRKTPQSKRQ